jgi:hypothetical protein
MDILERTIQVGAVSVTASELTQAITWLEENMGTRSTFTQGMKNLSNPLASWSASRGYTGLKGHPHSSTIPPKDRILSYLRLRLASADTGQGTENADETRPDTPTPGLSDSDARYRLDQAGSVNDWWAGDPRQRFWLEITDRPDIGVDLHCPQRGSNGQRSSGFSLMWWVRPGDVVFHYSLTRSAVTAWSRAAGPVYEAPTTWRPHRSATRRRIQQPVPQPGWWLDLDGPFPLGEPLPLAELARHQEQLRNLKEDLESRHRGSLYFPFFWWGGRQLRPMQYYLNKLPAETVALFPQLATAMTPASPPPPGAGAALVGADYRQAQVTVAPGTRQPFTVDPAIVERGLRGHADTQNELARVLREAGLTPRSRRLGEPNFDLAWQAGGTVFVAEVKSITNDNEEEQLRLGLGQVLRYRQQLIKAGHQHVTAVLVPEREPRDQSWADLCRELQVVLLPGGQLSNAPRLGRT